MSFAAITANSTTATQALNKAAKSSSLGMNADTFLQLFTTQISNQNPMEPMDSADFLNQFSQISQVQTMQEMQKSLDSLKSALSTLTTGSQQSRAYDTLGKNVEYTDSTGAKRTGVVDAVAMQTSGEVHLMVNGTAIEMEKVSKISEKPAPTAPVTAAQ